MADAPASDRPVPAAARPASQTDHAGAPAHERPGPAAGEPWERLRGWLQRRIAQMDGGDFTRLPESFQADGGRTAAAAYQTVLIAMNVIEGRRTVPGRAAAPPVDQARPAPPAVIPGPP